MMTKRQRDIPRREFVKTSLVIGGTSALSACLGRELPVLNQHADTEEFPRGDPDSLPERQHAWLDYVVRNSHGNTVKPQHQLVLGLSYVGSTPPTEDERRQVEQAFRSVERAHQWGTGGRDGAAINSGLLSLLGYSSQYFERIGSSVDRPMPAADVLRGVGEDPAKVDGFDAMLVLSSDFASILLGAEAGLFGEQESVNGVPMEATLEGIFEREERRTGITGKGNIGEKVEEAPEDAPLSMGFRSGFRDNQASEDAVTITDGPFANGTTMQASRLHIDIERWYDQSHEERTGEMFCPAHDPDKIGKTGDRLGATSPVTKADVENIEEDAEQYNMLGHSQKTARARDENFVPRIHRLSEGVATDVPEGVGFNFSSIQTKLEHFIETRKTMNVDEYDVDVPEDRHGIVDYLETRARGAYIIPPRSDRALPAP